MISVDDIGTEQFNDPPRVVIYGTPGIGKTTWAAYSESPIIVMAEKGLGRMTIPHFPRDRVLETYDEGIEILAWLHAEDHPYKTVIWDTLDWWEPLVWAKTSAIGGKTSIEDFGYGKGYLAALDQWRIFLDWMNALHTQRQMTIILTAHAEVKRFDSPETEPYDRFQMKLHKLAASLIEEWAEVLLFANWKTYTTKKDVGFKKEVTRGVGSGERVIYTEERPAYKAKNRFGLPLELPMPKDNPYAPFLQALIP